MTSIPHPSDERLTHPPDAEVAAHLAHCAVCRERSAGWQNMAVAARRYASEVAGEVVTPSFDTLLGDAIGMPWAAPAAAPRPTLRAALVLAAGTFRAQLRALPRALVPLSVLGFAGCVLLALAATRGGSPLEVFGLAVTLVFQIGTLAACGPRADPRLELFSTLSIPPAVVFACRLALVFGIDAALATVTSVVGGAVAGVDLSAMITGWLGPALLASAVGIVCAVWRSTTIGAVAGGAVWLLGAAGLSSTGPAHRLGALIEPLWSTSAATLVAAVVLLVAATVGMTKPRFGPAAA